MRHDLRSAARLLLLAASLTAAATSPSRAQTASQPASAVKADLSLDARLAWLQDHLEARRKELHIPGMAVAVVKDDKVILCRGFGQRNIEQNQPADENSLFCIGSSTKAFTSMLCAMMVDEGKMDFDKPVTTYLPDFKLKTDELTAATTMRDALAHRTGLTRTDMIWAANKVSRKDAIAQLRYVEPFAPPRTVFLYSNPMFMAAGDAAAAAAGAESWEKMVVDRIFTPLGMSGTTPLCATAIKDPRHATGYAWEKSSEKFRPLEMRILDCAAPAGAINSSATDMAKWLRFLLNKGELDGKRLVKASLFDSDLWATQMAMSPTASYGLGWMLEKWRDNKVVHHGGNIDGYAAMVAMLPDQHAGIVLLANVTASPLQEECKNLTWKALFGTEADFTPASSQPNAKTEEQLQPYLGKFDFTLQHSQVTALIKEGRLALDVPGQTVYLLKWPNEKGHWVFELTDAIEVEFKPGASGTMDTLTFYQAGQMFVLPRIGAVKPAPDLSAPGAMTEAQLKPYLGKYDFPVQKSQVTALIKDGKLAVDVPGQTIYALKWPNDKGRWVFELTDAIEVDFQKGDDGAMKSMTMYQAGQTFPMPRIAGGEIVLPSVADLSDMVVKGQRGPAPKAYRLTGTINFVHQGLNGPLTILVDGDKYKIGFDFGKFGYITTGYDGTLAYADTDLGESKLLEGDEAAQYRSLHPGSVFADPAKFYDKVEPLAWDVYKKTKVIKVQLTPKGAPATTIWYDASNGRPLHEEQARIETDLGIAIPTSIAYADYKPLGNVDYPTRIVVEDKLQGRVEMTIDKLEADAKIDPKELALPAKLKK